MKYALIPGCRGYRVSNTGVVESCRKRVGLGSGNGTKSVLVNVWHRLNTRKDRDGYIHVRIHDDNNRKLFPGVHRLVLIAFCGQPANGMQTRHIDGDKTNNKLSNLTWGTCTENNRDRIKHGTIPRGEKHCHAKLTEDVVREIRELGKTMGPAAISRAIRIAVDPVNISAVLKGKTWKHVK